MSTYERLVRGFFNAILWLIFLTGAALTIYMAAEQDMTGTMLLFVATLMVTSVAYFFVRLVMFVSFGPAEPPLPPVLYPEMHVHVHCEPGVQPQRPPRGEPHFDQYIDADFRELGGKHAQITVSRLDRILDDRRGR